MEPVNASASKTRARSLTPFTAVPWRTAKTARDPIFGFEIVTECPGVPAEILRPRESWADKSAYDATAKKLAALFNKNFETYAAGASAEVKAAAPVA